MERRVSSLALALALVIPALAAALDKEEKQWLEDVKPLILPAEEKLFGGLKAKEDRAEFQKIFWARRDPNLLTPENEYQKTYEERRAKAKELYTWKGMDRDAGVFLPRTSKAASSCSTATASSPCRARTPRANRSSRRVSYRAG
jgi:GWxTD domain-containing protein